MADHFTQKQTQPDLRLIAASLRLAKRFSRRSGSSLIALTSRHHLDVDFNHTQPKNMDIHHAIRKFCVAQLGRGRALPAVAA